MWTVPATVIEMVDGDTVKLELDLGWHITLRARCRVAGIDAPEMDTVEGVQAKVYAQGLMPPGVRVFFLSHSLDKYGRPLGTIRLDELDGPDFGQLMLDAGHAVVRKS